MSSAVSKSASNEVSQPAQQGVVETKESSASANASAGVNLNLVGAVKGLFSSKSQKDTAADGSSTETKEEHADVKGVGEGTLNAVGSASASENARETRAAITQDKS